jgi:hypothetical protein
VAGTPTYRKLIERLRRRIRGVQARGARTLSRNLFSMRRFAGSRREPRVSASRSVIPVVSGQDRRRLGLGARESRGHAAAHRCLDRSH